MNTSQAELYTQIISSRNLNAVLLKKDLSNINQVDIGLRQRLYRDYGYRELEEMLQKCGSVVSFTQVQDRFALHWYWVCLPEQFSDRHNSRFITLGPFLRSNLSREQILQVLSRNQLPLFLLPELQEYYSRLPVFTDLNTLEGWLLSIAAHFFQCDFSVFQFETQLQENLSADYPLNDDPHIASSTIEERYALEETLLKTVSRGDYAAAIPIYYHFRSYRINPRSQDLIHNEKSLLLVLNTLCRKALQYDSMVHPLYLDDLSTKLAIAVNECKTKRELEELSLEMLRRYCHLARNHSMKEYSPLVQNVLTYIEFHYTENLSLHLLAEKYSVSRNYLAALFKRERGCTVTDYIHTVRLRKAFTLMNSTKLPIHLIASACGYEDPNYFIRVFRKRHGQTPKQYQKQMLNTDAGS